MGKYYCDWLARLKKGDEVISVKGAKPNLVFSKTFIKGMTKTKIRTPLGEFERDGGRSVQGSQHGGLLPPTEALLKRIEEQSTDATT